MLELLIASALAALVVSALLQVMNPTRGGFSTEPERADMQQRLRVAHDGLSKDLIMAGAGPYLGSRLAIGPLDYYFAPVLPYRVGARNADRPGTVKADTITVFYVPSTAAQASLADLLPPGATTMRLADDCPSRANACGFASGQTIVVFDTSGNYASFTIAAAPEGTYTLEVDRPSRGTVTYAPGSTVVQVVQRTYSLKQDQENGVYQLTTYDGSSSADAPVVDHVVGLAFEYDADPQPPQLTGASNGPRTTYGPAPPAPDVQSTAYPMGENCTFRIDADSRRHVPRLPLLGATSTSDPLVRLNGPQLLDGPWCPDELASDRWDADLLRIRRIGVTLRVEAAIAALRGPAGILFAHAGTSVGGGRWAPDQEIRFQIAPRNLNLGH